MFCIRVTAPDGSSRTQPLTGTQLHVGRDASNGLVLDGVGVSSHHCMFELGQGGVCTLKERGSTNGTWLNGARVQEPTRIGFEDRIHVGPFLLELVQMAPEPERAVAQVHIPSGEAPILRSSGPHRSWRNSAAKITRYAEQWDAGDRVPRLLLTGDELRAARRWIAVPPPSPAEEPGRLVREFIAASAAAASRRSVLTLVVSLLAVLVVGGGLSAGVIWWLRREPTPPEPAPTPAELEHEPPPVPPPVIRRPDPPTSPGEERVDTEGPITHVVIPTETLHDVAKRYGVSDEELIDWNVLDPEAALEVGAELLIKKPKIRALPQAEVKMILEGGETWRDLSERFGLDVTRLRKFNPGLADLTPGATLTVWIEPKPYKPRNPGQRIPEFFVDHASKSVGNPNNGRIENGVQLPDDPNYTKVSGFVWGSAFTIQKLREALATFRRDVDYEGLIIVSDLSKQGGGHFDPHKSHQAGRDVDIWLPSVRGAYRPNENAAGRKKWRRPVGGEVDFYATFGLVRALIQTGAVKYVFLDWDRQKYVYEAARQMGATPEQLDAWIQYPRPKGLPKGFLRHSEAHFSHVHVRFLCADWEDDCKDINATPDD